ncbi:UNVERIFIED_CONTAM: hypothetical protein PYX00_008579 [Menopon gallinae]|uniref:Alanine--glyoxylate aminotransferase 2, mitochondrial n=1 Tax=Menopon gallinae TaxID=328185 RepID=A0AAW2HNI1_9NEOP
MLLRCIRGYATANLPRSDFVPEKYVGPSYEKVLAIRSGNLVPCIKSHFRKPVLIHQGHMQWLFDHTGKRYLDMFGGIVTVSVGHCHPRVTEALKKQISTLWHTTNIYMHPKIHEYAEALAEKFPGDLKVVYFVNSGSEANDMALLLARIHTGNSDVIALRNAYHGGASSTINLTALSTWKFPIQSSNIHYAKNPDVYKGPFGGRHCRDSPVQTQRKCSCRDECEAAEAYVDDVREIIDYNLPKGKVAGFFAESIQGVGGSVQYPQGYLRKVYDLVRGNGGVCIADEVQTGFGRTGTHFWGFQNHDVVPDIVTMAKGIGNGFPLGAVVTTPEIARSLTKALHFNTFGGNPMASAVGLEVLKVIEDERLQENSHRVGYHLLEKLAKLRDKFEIVGDVRGKGLMIGMEMVEDKESKTPVQPHVFADIWERCKDAGLLLGVGGLKGNVGTYTFNTFTHRKITQFSYLRYSG